MSSPADDRGAADTPALRGYPIRVITLARPDPDAAAGFADAWRRYRELRMDVALAASALDCLAVAPPGDPLADTAAREARPILEREGANAHLRQLEELLAGRSAATPGRTGGRPAVSPSDMVTPG